MSKVSEINKRIEGKVKELRQDNAAIDNADKVVSNVKTKAEEVRDELRKVRKILDRRRIAIQSVRTDLKEAELGSPDEDTEEEVRLRHWLDHLSGLIEESIAMRNRLLARLDRLAERDATAEKVRDEALSERSDDRDALERMRERRRKIKERKDRPSPNFSWNEFDCNDGTPYPPKSEIAIKHWCETVGEPARKRFGAVHINSGFRHRAYNASVGGEPNSVHIYDFPGRDFKAVAGDFRCATGNARQWYDFTAGKADGRGLYGTFHHADNRNRLGWPDTTWTG